MSDNIVTGPNGEPMIVYRGLGQGFRPSPLTVFPESELKPENVEGNDQKAATPIHTLAIDDLRPLRMQHQLAGRDAISQRTLQLRERAEVRP